MDKFEFNIQVRPTMYNTSYDSNFPIQLEKLFEIIYHQYLLKSSSYEPEIHAFAKIVFFWNHDYLIRSDLKPGVCYCDVICSGSQCGKGNGNCKKITASIYQSGKISISGANLEQQVVTMYNFLNRIFEHYYQDIYQKQPKAVIFV